MNGLIPGATLRSNAIRHESGLASSHYAQYLAINADPTKNVGTGAELQLAGPNTSEVAFVSVVSSRLDDLAGAMETATNTPEPFGATYDVNGTLQGYVSYATYTACHP